MSKKVIVPMETIPITELLNQDNVDDKNSFYSEKIGNHCTRRISDVTNDSSENSFKKAIPLSSKVDLEQIDDNILKDTIGIVIGDVEAVIENVQAGRSKLNILWADKMETMGYNTTSQRERDLKTILAHIPERKVTQQLITKTIAYTYGFALSIACIQR